jgi:CHASE2 domain-containing sensor protein
MNKLEEIDSREEKRGPSEKRQSPFSFGNVRVVLFLLVVSAGCKQQDQYITIVDIASLDRIGLARQLEIINECSPKAVALYFMLTTDSLEKGERLVRALSNVKNLVQGTILHNFVDHEDYWDSLETNHSKFGLSPGGFLNITSNTEKPYIISPEMPLEETYKDVRVPSFSYAIALQTYGVNSRYKKTGPMRYDNVQGFIGRYFKIITSNELLERNFDKDDLRDKIVIMGYIGDDEDLFYLDNARTRKINGVEIQASFVRAVMQRP